MPQFSENSLVETPPSERRTTMTNIKSHYYLVGYAQDGMEQKKVFMKPTAENIANFIMQNKEASIIITDELDLPVITAYQGFVHTCDDKKFLLREPLKIDSQS